VLVRQLVALKLYDDYERQFHALSGRLDSRQNPVHADRVREAAAPRRRLSRSSSEPRCTSAPATAKDAAAASERAAENLMTRGDQLSDDGGTNKTGGAGDEDTHEEVLHVLP
jgi:hypothetical protein